MESSRLTKRIFLWDYDLVLTCKTWCKDLVKIFNVIDCMYIYDRKIPCDIAVVKLKLMQINIES